MSVRQVTLYECDDCHKKSEKQDEIRSWKVEPNGVNGLPQNASTFDACSPACAGRQFKIVADMIYTRPPQLAE